MVRVFFLTNTYIIIIWKQNNINKKNNNNIKTNVSDTRIKLSIFNFDYYSIKKIYNINKLVIWRLWYINIIIY